MTIERIGQRLRVYPPCKDVLDGLTTAMHVAAVHGSEGFKVVPRPVPLWAMDDSIRGEEAWVLPGLERDLVAALGAAGRDVVVEPRPIATLPPPVVDGLLDPAFVGFVGARDRGVVGLAPGVEPERLVAQVRRAYPGATIAVAATRQEDVRRFGRRLGEHSPGSCWSIDDDFPMDPGPLVVSTYMGLGDHGVALRKRDFLFCLDAREATGSAVQMPIADAARARLVAFTPLGPRLAPYDADRVAALFGRDRLDVPRHGGVAREVEVHVGRIAGSAPSSGPGPVDLKRRAIWDHPVRNRRIGRLAAALAAGGAAAVAELPSLGPNGTRPAGDVVVLVEGVEHAASMARHLPGWDAVLGPHVDPSDLPGWMRPGLARKPPTAGRRLTSIATLDGLAEFDLAATGVVVRADAGHGVPGVLAGPMIVDNRRAGPLVVVDFDDRHHPALRRRARDRRDAYLALGWPVDGPARPGVRP